MCLNDATIASTRLWRKTSARSRSQVRETLAVICRTCVAVTILALLGGVAAASRAQDVSSAPAGTRPLADPPFPLILPRQHLLSAISGERAWLQERATTPKLTFLTDAPRTPTRGPPHFLTHQPTHP